MSLQKSVELKLNESKALFVSDAILLASSVILQRDEIENTVVLLIGAFRNGNYSITDIRELAAIVKTIAETFEPELKDKE